MLLRYSLHGSGDGDVGVYVELHEGDCAEGVLGLDLLKGGLAFGGGAGAEEDVGLG